MFEQPALVAFDHHHVAAPALLHDRAGGLHLGVQRVQQHGQAVEFQPAQERLAGGNFVALVGHALDPDGAPAL